MGWRLSGLGVGGGGINFHLKHSEAIKIQLVLCNGGGVGGVHFKPTFIIGPV